jgi:hypothetical protein
MATRQELEDLAELVALRVTAPLSSALAEVKPVLDRVRERLDEGDKKFAAIDVRCETCRVQVVRLTSKWKMVVGFFVILGGGLGIFAGVIQIISLLKGVHP